MKNIIPLLQLIGGSLFIILVMWIAFSTMYCRVVNPWMTDMEILISLDRVIRLEHIDYNEFRKQY